jgi:hypothetical protein
LLQEIRKSVPHELSFLIVLMTLMFFFVVAAPYLYAKASVLALSRRCREMGALVLTYDDGPGTALRPELLELLRRHNVKATFFSLGARGAACPEMMEAAAKDGHELACHGFNHPHPWKSWPWISDRDIRMGYQALSPWLPPNALFRPPHGKITLFSLIALLKRKAPIVWWTHDSGDTCSGPLPPAGDVADRVVRSGGGVVLLHDFDRTGHASGIRHEYVLNTTASLIEAAAEAGLRIMTAGDLLRQPPVARQGRHT